MMTPERLREIKERCERATPGPWKWDDTTWGEGKRLLAVGRKDQWGDVLTLLDDGSAAGEYSPTDATEADRDFIARAREDVPALVAEVERLQAFLGELRELVRRWRHEAARYRRKADVASDETNFAGYDGQAMALMRCASDLEDMLNQLEDGAHA